MFREGGLGNVQGAPAVPTKARFIEGATPGSWLWPAVPALLVGLICLLAGLSVLWKGHPHEDAYILFRYASNLGSGAGIRFYPGGPRAEGATDFLWLVLLAIGSRLGLDPAVGAAVLSAISLAGIVALFLVLVPLERRSLQGWHLGLMPAVLLASCSTAAGYAGFSAVPYGLLGLGALVAWLRGRAALLAIPPLALLLGLFRPDGVVIGGSFMLLGLIDTREGHLRSRFRLYSLGCLLAGAAYFLWRWSYFGQVLPLPFHVKFEHDQASSGWLLNRLWFIRTASPLFLLSVMAAILTPPGKRRLAAGVLPFALHVGLLSFSTQSQNVAERYQSPAVLACFLAFFVMLARMDLRGWKKPAVLLCVLLAFYPQFSATRATIREVTRNEYIDRFAHDSGALLGPEDTIAVTEAGRLGYWSRAKVVDLVGLNTPEIGTRGLRISDLELSSPDVVMFHTARTLDSSWLPRSEDPVAIDEPLIRHIRPEYAEQVNDPEGRHTDPVIRAPLIAALYLSRHRSEYDVFGVRYYGALVHIYGIRKSWPKHDAYVELLMRARHLRPEGYLELLSSCR